MQIWHAIFLTMHAAEAWAVNEESGAAPGQGHHDGLAHQTTNSDESMKAPDSTISLHKPKDSKLRFAVLDLYCFEDADRGGCLTSLLAVGKSVSWATTRGQAHGFWGQLTMGPKLCSAKVAGYMEALEGNCSWQGQQLCAQSRHSRSRISGHRG